MNRQDAKKGEERGGSPGYEVRMRGRGAGAAGTRRGPERPTTCRGHRPTSRRGAFNTILGDLGVLAVRSSIGGRGWRNGLGAAARSCNEGGGGRRPPSPRSGHERRAAHHTRTREARWRQPRRPFHDPARTRVAQDGARWCGGQMLHCVQHDREEAGGHGGTRVRNARPRSWSSTWRRAPASHPYQPSPAPGRRKSVHIASAAPT